MSSEIGAVMRLILKSPVSKGLLAYIGFDRTGLGWFCTIEKEGKAIKEYDSLTEGEETSLKGALNVLVQYEFFTQEVLEAALEVLFAGDVKDAPNYATKRVCKLIIKLKEGASQ